MRFFLLFLLIGKVFSCGSTTYNFNQNYPEIGSIGKVSYLKKYSKEPYCTKEIQDTTIKESSQLPCFLNENDVEIQKIEDDFITIKIENESFFVEKSKNLRFTSQETCYGEIIQNSLYILIPITVFGFAILK